MLNAKFAGVDALAEEAVLGVDVFKAPLLHRVHRNLNDAEAVRLEDGLDVDPEASEDVADKEELARSFDCGYEFGFNGREGHTPLELRAPAD